MASGVVKGSPKIEIKIDNWVILMMERLVVLSFCLMRENVVVLSVQRSDPDGGTVVVLSVYLYKRVDTTLKEQKEVKGHPH